MNKINIAVFFGGETLENEVSKITGAQVINALNKDKYNIYPVYIDENFNWWYVKNYPQEMDLNTTKKTKINIFNGENCFNFNNLIKNKINIHCAILATHGGKGENGTLSGILNSLNIPHTASNTLSSALTMNKYLTKVLIKENKLNFLPFEIFTKKEFRSFNKKDLENIFLFQSQENYTPNLKQSTLNRLKQFISKIKFPLVVKPADQGSSIAVSFVDNLNQLYPAMELASAYSKQILIEKGVRNVIEYNCSAMKIGNQIKVSEIEKPIHKNAILTYLDKYGSKLGSKLTDINSTKLLSSKITYSTNTNAKKEKPKNNLTTKNQQLLSKGMECLSRELPAKIPAYLKEKIENLTSTVYQIFDCDGIVRCDFIYYKKRLYLNEINSIPGSLANYLWLTKGYTFSTLLDEIIRNSIKSASNKNY